MQDFGFYLGLGWEHIISRDALDHQLFIAALAALYIWQDWKKVLVLVTAFTIGHSLTLELSVLDLIRLPDQLVEFMIPCTIVLTAISNFFQKNFSTSSLRINYFLALFFGLIHGMGFANTIRFMLSKDQHLATGLLGFNLGLELGQIVVVALLLGITQLVVGPLNLKRRTWVILLSALVLGVALTMMAERL
jgi:hypothetical protein